MSRRKKHVSHVNHERWLVSYADFITLLFAFFVVMYATAQVDKKKMNHLAVAIRVAFKQMGTLPPATDAVLEIPEVATTRPITSRAILLQPEQEDLSDLRDRLEKTLSAEISVGKVAVRDQPDGLVVSLRETGFFDSGSAGVKPGATSSLTRIADLLTQRTNRIRIEGYTDDQPIHNSKFNSNWELSTARATEMIRLLIQKYSFDPGRLSAGGYANYHPIADNITSEGRALNRRVDVVILRNDIVPIVAPPEPAKPSPSIPKSDVPR